MPQNIVFVKIDTDENPELARNWDIQGIPAMVRIEDGKETGRLIGFRPEAEVAAFARAQ